MRNFLTNRFENTRILEQSSRKTTFVGTDHLLNESDVLVKIIRKGHFSCAREALSLSFSWQQGIQHPYLGKVLDAGLTNSQDLYYVREYVGETWSTSGDEPDYIGQLVTAVSLFHASNRIHGGIKPSNIFQANGSLKLVDPRIPEIKQTELTDEGIRFTAPEVLAGADASAEADLYSVGAVIYRLLSGRDVFDDFDLDNLRSKYMWASPRPLSSVSYVSKSISNLVELLLDKNPHKRPSLSLLAEAFPNRVKAIRAPFIGRAAEMQTIQHFFERPSPCGLKVVLLEGEPGIGKTRFLQELGRTGHEDGRIILHVLTQALSGLQIFSTSKDETPVLGNRPERGFDCEPGPVWRLASPCSLHPGENGHRGVSFQSVVHKDVSSAPWLSAE